jgi:Ca2+-binding RTX toxin-like protein
MTHITAGTSAHVASGNAFSGPGPGPSNLVVDADAFLISDSSGSGANLIGTWTVTVNGAVESFGNAGIDAVSSLATYNITIGSTGDVFGNSAGIFSNGTVVLTNLGTIASKSDGIQAGSLTLVNKGTISGDTGSIAVSIGVAHITNLGTLQGDVDLFSGANDIFNDFKKVGKVVKNGTVVGTIDLGDGADHFKGGAHSETVRDGGGADIYKFGGGNDTYLAVSVSGTTGADTIDGGKGTDTYDATGATFTVLVNLDAKPQGLLSAQFAQGADVGDVGNTDKVIGFENAIGGSAADALYGSSGANVLNGGAGGDELHGLGGRDVLTGGADNDTFFFEKLSDSGATASTRDVITDFATGDKINLSTIDANGKLAGDPGFTYIDTAHFNHTAGQLRESYSGGNTIVSGDVNGDGKADFSVALKGHILLHVTDFIP